MIIHKQYPKIITFIALVVVVSMGCAFLFGYLYSSIHAQTRTENQNIPHVYYSAMRVTRVDDQGNVVGKTSVYRIDGLRGTPVKIADLPQETGVSQIQFHPTTFQYNVFSTANRNYPQTDFQVSLDWTGHDVQNIHQPVGLGNVKNQVLLRQQWIHPEGAFAVTSEVYCTDTPLDGPCARSFRVVVTDLSTNMTHTLSPASFGADLGYQAVLLSALTPTSVLFVIQGQEEMMTAVVGVLNLDTAIIYNLFTVPKDKPNTSWAYEFVRLSDDQSSAIFLQWYVDSNLGKQLISMDVQNGFVNKLSGIIQADAVEWPQHSSNFFFENTATRTVTKKSIQSGAEQIVAHDLTVADYLHPHRYSVQQLSSDADVYAGKLVITDRLTSRYRVVYNQSQQSNAYPSTNKRGGRGAVVGDIIYNYIGIDQ